ncbi:MAG: class D sortase [Eubacterium sp.]|nr:class D sortase [Eubacterium sp.]
MGSIKRILTCVLSAVFILTMTVGVFAAEINVDERRILDNFNEEPFKTRLDKKYIIQFENYFSRDNVDIEKPSADAFLQYFSRAVVEYKNSKGKGAVFSQSDVSFEYFQYAGETIGLYLEYDSNTNSFYAVDNAGYVVIDSQKIIKDTGDNSKAEQSEGKSFSLSIEMIFAGIVFLIFIGFLINAKKWVVKIRKHHDKNYDDEFDDEMEVANRKTRRARLQTFSYNNFKQVVKYFYVPILMCVVVVGAGYLFYKPYTTLLKSIKEGFVQNLTLNTYAEDTKDFSKTPLIKSKTIKGSDVSWPKYTEPYGVITCGKIKLDAPLYMGDSDYVLSGKVKSKVENDYDEAFSGELDEEFKGAAGTYIGSSIPGDGKTILVGAHDTTYFKPLEKVAKGMVMNVTTTYAKYKYKVRDIRIYDENEIDKAYNLQSKKEQLILYTCYPFGKLKGDKTKRYFVYLDKIFGPSIDKEVTK